MKNYTDLDFENLALLYFMEDAITEKGYMFLLGCTVFNIVVLAITIYIKYFS